MLELKNISKTFNKGTINAKLALDNLSLTLNDGDFVTVIGGNGAGNYDVQSQNNTTVSEFNDGITFYSGGGGVGQWTSNPKENGGKPNGAYGAAALVDNTGTATSKNAGTAGIGGGGGGAAWSSTYDSEKTRTGNSSAGGPGLVAIRLHFS